MAVPKTERTGRYRKPPPGRNDLSRNPGGIIGCEKGNPPRDGVRDTELSEQRSSIAAASCWHTPSSRSTSRRSKRASEDWVPSLNLL
jgi:hypothetical protein